MWNALIDHHLNELGTVVWTGIQEHMGEIATAIWTALSHWLYGLLRGLLVTMWNATLLAVPHSTTDNLNVVQTMMPNSTVLAAWGITIALALLGVREILSGVWGNHRMVDYLIGRFLTWVTVLSFLAWMISYSIDMEQDLARSVALAGIEGILPPTESVMPNPIALILMIVLGLRLWLKLASNVVHIAVDVTWSPVAGICGLIPDLSHISTLWVHEFFGRLAGAVLATVACAIGLALTVTTANDFAIFGTAGAFLAAHDYVDLLTKSRGGGTLGGVMGRMLGVGAAVMGALPLAGAASAGAAAAPAMSTVPTNYAPALTSGRAMYSFD